MNQSNLLHLLKYDATSGEFTWLNPISTKFKKGDAAGSLRPDGYMQIKLSGKIFLSHRLAWLYVHGEMPDCIDHANKNRRDNRLCNLRVASRSQNGANRDVYKNNKTGFKGVVKRKNRFVASLRAHGKRIEMGYYDTPEKAASAYSLGAYLYHGEFASW